MKLSNKIKLISAASLTTLMPMVLCQCSNTGHSDPTIDPTISKYVDMKVTTDVDSNKICELTIKDAYKATKQILNVIVTIGNETLINGTHYILLEPNNGPDIVVKIFKLALDKFGGDVKVKPILIEREQILTNIDVEYPTFLEINSTWKASDVHVYPYYNDVKSTSEFVWNKDYLLYHYGTETQIEEFDTKGYNFVTEGTYKFTIKCITNPSIKKDLEIKVEDTSRVTISYICSNGTLKGSEQVRVTPGTKWGESPQPWSTPDYGYGPSRKWRFNSPDGEEVSRDYEINSNITICICYYEKEIKGTDTKTIDTYTEKFGDYDTYVPAENVDVEDLKYIDYLNNYQYTFEVQLGTIKNIKYFWLYVDETTDKMYTFQNAKLITVKHTVDGQTRDVPFKISPYVSPGGGTFLTLGSDGEIFNEGKLEVTVKFFESNKFIPAFQASVI